MKYKVAVYLQNQGDGSSRVCFFNSEAEAEGAANNHNERFCEDVYSVELEFSDDGKLISSRRVS